MTEHLSNKMSNMALACAFMVVVLHMAGSSEVGHPTWWTHHVIGVGFCGIAVPYFFLASGYFIEARLHQGVTYLAIVRKRWHTLLIPFIIWNLLYAAFMLGTISAVDLLAHRPLGTNVHVSGWQWLGLLGLYPFSNPYLGPMWFIRGLFLVILCIPLLRWLLDYLGAWTPALLFAIMYFTMSRYPPRSVSYSFWRYTVPTTGFLYFTVGMWLRRHPIPDGMGRKVAFLVLPIGIAVQFAEVWLHYRGVHCPIYWRGIMIPLVMGGAWYLMPSRALPSWLKGMSFPIYVLHYFFISAVFFLNHDPNSVLFYLARGVCGLVGPIVLTLILRKLLPSFAYIAFGGR